MTDRSESEKCSRAYLNDSCEDSQSHDRREMIRICDNLSIDVLRTIGRHGNVFEGQIASRLCGARSCVVKFSAISEQNMREASILTKLGSHSNVISLIQSGTYCDGFEERCYVALDQCHGENLRQYLANRREDNIRFDSNQASEFAKQIVNGVVYIHDNNVIHLDLKPSNILLSQNLRLVKIADFGLSVEVKSPKSKLFHKNQFGSNGYRPVESFGNGVISQKTDIFSLGALLFHVLSNGKDVFGQDEHTFVHNVTNDITDTSGLLVSNPNATEYLIKSMVRKERCKRPNIWQVLDHPCWNGREAKCHFDDLVADESDSSDEETTIKKANPPTNDFRVRREFIRKMRDFGFRRKSTIAVFDRFTRVLFHVDWEREKLSEMRQLNEHLNFGTFRAISFREHIYVFKEDSCVYRLEYGDVEAQWERMADAIGRHGDWPQAVASSDHILLVGGSNLTFSKALSKFHPDKNRWEAMNGKRFASSNSALLVHERFLYCFGGATGEQNSINAVEKMDLNTQKWYSLANMNVPRHGAAAAEHCAMIYVTGGITVDERLRSAEVYDIHTDQWTILQPMSTERAFLRCFAIENRIFAVIGDHYPKTIESYDVSKSKWELVTEFKGLFVNDSVLIQMSV